MAVEFPQASEEIRALLKNPDIKGMIASVEELLLDDKDLTPEEWKYYQRRIEGKIDTLADEIKTTAKSLTEIDPADPIAVKQRKVKLQKNLISFLQTVFDKLKQIFKWIFDQIKNGIKWCWGKLKEAYSSFKKLFS